jgi:hypothetical protein
MNINEQITELELQQSKLRKLMDDTSTSGVIVSQGWGRKPLFIQGTPPSIFAMEAYRDTEVMIQELRLKQTKAERVGNT